MKIATDKIIICCLSTLNLLMVYFLAESQIIASNAYAGMVGLSFGFEANIASLAFLVSMLFLFFNNDVSPQGIFVATTLLLSNIWFFVFYSVSGYGSAELLGIAAFILFFPLLLVTLSGRLLKINYIRGMPISGMIPVRVELVIVLLLTITSLVIYGKVGIGFSLEESYTRRASGRTLVTGFSGYLFAICVNGLAPLLSFLAVYNRRFVFLLPAIVFSILGYGFTGVKAPLGYVGLMAMFAIFYNSGGRNIMVPLTISIFFTVGVAILEYFTFEFSLIADFIIRRAFLLSSQLKMYYIDFLSTPTPDFDMLAGFRRDYSVTYHIGDVYKGDIESNANTISFLTTLAQNGIFGYIFNVVFVAVFFGFLNSLYKKTQHKVWLAIAMLYSLIMLEQSFTIAFVTSGIGASVLLLLIFQYQVSLRR